MHFSVQDRWIAFADMMMRVMMRVVTALAFRVRQLMPLRDIIQQTLAVLLHLQRDINVGRDESPPRGPLWSE